MNVYSNERPQTVSSLKFVVCLTLAIGAFVSPMYLFKPEIIRAQQSGVQPVEQEAQVHEKVKTFTCDVQDSSSMTVGECIAGIADNATSWLEYNPDINVVERKTDLATTFGNRPGHQGGERTVFTITIFYRTK